MCDPERERIMAKPPIFGTSSQTSGFEEMQRAFDRTNIANTTPGFPIRAADIARQVAEASNVPRYVTEALDPLRGLYPVTTASRPGEPSLSTSSIVDDASRRATGLLGSEVFTSAITASDIARQANQASTTLNTYIPTSSVFDEASRRATGLLGPEVFASAIAASDIARQANQASTILNTYMPTSSVVDEASRRAVGLLGSEVFAAPITASDIARQASQVSANLYPGLASSAFETASRPVAGAVNLASASFAATAPAVADDASGRSVAQQVRAVEAPVPIRSAADLGRQIRAARDRLGLSQQIFADMAGVGRRFVSELEAGKPTLELGKVLAACQAAGIDLQSRSR
jgi:HTH-type transcriptional regulator/antitoxin HipB